MSITRKDENKMSYGIGDAVKVEVYITPKISRIAVCKITNKYTRNNKNYYSIREVNGSYMCSNIKEDRFITMETFGFDSEWVDTDLRVLKVFCDGDNGLFSVLIDTYSDHNMIYYPINVVFTDIEEKNFRNQIFKYLKKQHPAYF